ncbi:MAG: TatD family hydrolase [Rickettsiales bacterium]|jgi:TatD DNase family protein|nr:TatD family hydrolase [Rickettsiales bacterium]
MIPDYDFLIDSHCHLLHLADQGVDLEGALERASLRGVALVNNVCASLEEMPKILSISADHGSVFCSVGHHPDEVRRRKITLEEIMPYGSQEKVVALGETGLDYHFSSENRKDQIENFRIHIEASRRSGLPLIIHSREADGDMIDLLRSETRNGPFTFVLHCFCSSRELALAGLDLGGFISFSGIVTFKNALELREHAKIVPRDRIIVETDSPYLAPVPWRGKINEPAYSREVAEFLSTLLGEDYGTFRRELTRNTLKLFDRIRVPPELSGSATASPD